MAGVTDLPFRNLCRDLGAGAAVAEMLTSDQSLWQSRKSTQRQVCSQETGLRWIQILGNDPQQMASAAQECERRGAQVIDINMGCPAKKVCRKAAGSALLQDEALVAEILKAVVAAVSIPVTLKTRTGFSHDQKNVLVIARIAEDSGVAAFTLHGRTRADGYDVAAEHDTVATIKQYLTIPVIANGDITTVAQAKFLLQQTGVDAVMIGRAALGNPWLFQQLRQGGEPGGAISSPTRDEVVAVMARHVRNLHEHYGDYLGLRIARKHVAWYQEQFPQYLDMRRDFNLLASPDAQLALLRALALQRAA